MRRTAVVVSGLALFAAGFVAGHLDLELPANLKAQTDEPLNLTDDEKLTFGKAFKSMTDLDNMLTAKGRSTSATNVPGDVNYFSVSVGGVDVLRDLEEGRGVDPETFAALYSYETRNVAGKDERVYLRLSIDVSQHLDTDDRGRIRYKGKVVQIYSTERLNQCFSQRDAINKYVTKYK